MAEPSNVHVTMNGPSTPSVETDEQPQTQSESQQVNDSIVNADDEQLVAEEPKYELSVNDENSDQLTAHKQKPQLCGTTRGLALLIIINTVFAVGITLALIIHISVSNDKGGLHGAVASESTICSKVGVMVLKQGGNSVDAAIATLFCLGVTENQHCGIGGGGFMLIHDHMKNTSAVIDFRETAPGAANESLEYRERGSLSVAVPGQLKGLEHAHKKYGKLDWKKLVAPSINIARKGFPISESAVHSLRSVSKAYINGTRLGDIYLKDGSPLRWIDVNSTVTRPHLARTYEIIADKGADAFYDGELTKSILDAMPGGIMTVKDLKDYEVVDREALVASFHTVSENYTVVTMPLPGGGPALINILNIISGFNWTPEDLDSPKRYYEMLEAFRYAYAGRSGLGDPAFDPSGLIAKVNATMTSLKVAKGYRDEIAKRNHTQPEDSYPIYGLLPVGTGTTHVSVIDSDELYVSVTSSLDYIMGSKIMTSTGIILNNHMADFTPSILNMTTNKVVRSVNGVAPGKRPLSDMAPTVVFNTKEKCGPRLILGGINGSHIIAGVAEVIFNEIIFGMNLTSSVNRSRIINVLSNITHYNDGLSMDIVEPLRDYGYTLQSQSARLSYIMAISKVNDTTQAVSDPGVSGKADMY